jgi:hypothetical protein
MKVHLVLQSYGNTREYKRAIFCIWSYFTQTNTRETEVSLFTDGIEWMAPYLKGLPVRFIEITPAKLSEMRGGIDFVHRVKIATIEEAFRFCDWKMLYVDSDTFFISDPIPFLKQVSASVTFMHRFEYRFSDMKKFPLPSGAAFHHYYDVLMEKTFRMHDGRDVQASPDQVSWNAGAILLDPSHQILLQDVYTITDETFPETRNHGCEQFAFCIVLENYTTVQPCYDMIYHYWPVVKKNIADKFLNSRIDTNWSVRPEADKRNDVVNWIGELPHIFKSDILRLRDESILAFNTDNFGRGFQLAWKSLLKAPDFQFSKDVLYHAVRFIRSKSR